MIFDSTGLKVRGEGEWKVRTHGKNKRRTWRKFHIAIDADTQEIISFELTGTHGGDAAAAKRMMSRMSAGTEHRTRKLCVRQRIGRERDACLAETEGLGGDQVGRRLWKKRTGYHQRSLVATTMDRIKTMCGAKLKGRSLEAQRAESYCKCLVINKMNNLG